MSLEGGCLCGHVRYNFVNQIFTAICHCKDCTKQSGSAYAVLIAISPDQLKITKGEEKLKTFITTSIAGNKVRRHFCENCGSPVLIKLDSNANLIFVNEGTLDDTSGVKPNFHIFAKDKQSWVNITDDIPAYQILPPPQTSN